ncbi:head GIN domain-containing protein [Spongiimicrobium salis]|uniref:head GIN domain-containing protein n=1 Tax=Spongiimicrobium salis TaxID=1667022 RepID=UPI00374CE679
MLKLKNTSLLFVFVLSVLGWNQSTAQSKTFSVDSFEKVIVSPHIQVTFRQGDTEKVVIENASVSLDKINVEVEGNTLRLYLDGAKVITKSEKVNNDHWKGKRSIYEGTKVSAVVTYKKLESLSLRGEESFLCESPLEAEKFRLKIYGESQVYFNEVDFTSLTTTIYGESYLEIKKGRIDHHKIKAYGESTINTLGVNNKNTKVTAFGEGSYRVKTSNRLKVTAFGEATVAYEGNPQINRGIILGEATIRKMQ